MEGYRVKVTRDRDGRNSRQVDGPPEAGERLTSVEITRDKTLARRRVEAILRRRRELSAVARFWREIA